MPHQLTTNEDALRLFFTDDIYLVADNTIPATPPQERPEAAETKTASENNALTHEFKFLGKNGRNILILVNDEENEVSDEDGRELLRKIVKSINLSAADFALLNYAKHRQAKFTDLISFFSSRLIFSFGVSPLHLGLTEYPHNKVVNEGEVRLIFSQELRALNQDLEVKKALWSVLQKLPL